MAVSSFKQAENPDEVEHLLRRMVSENIYPNSITVKTLKQALVDNSMIRFTKSFVRTHVLTRTVTRPSGALLKARWTSPVSFKT